MSEVYWPPDAESLPLRQNIVYAQTFTPLWSHTLDHIRIFIKYIDHRSEVKASIQYLKPDGTPTGMDITSYTFSWTEVPRGRYTSTRQRDVPPIRIVEGINYAFVLEQTYATPPYRSSTLYIPAPSGYPRGKLIKSIDGGATWDTADLGDMLFGEYGDPPVRPNRYTAPIEHIAVDNLTHIDYKTNACLRVTTTAPSTLTLVLSEEKPEPLEEPRPRRGGTQMCLESYHMTNWRSYAQLEKDDSMYHTFFLTRLNAGKPYWVSFTSLADFAPGYTAAPIFKLIHPEAPPFTTIKRPFTFGSSCQIWDGTPHDCPDHYLNVNESTPDEDVSWVAENGNWNRTATDLYHIHDFDPSDAGPWDKIVISVRLKFQGGYAYASSAWTAIKTHGHVYVSDNWGPLWPAYKNYHWHLRLNPFTGEPWTIAELNDLQIGVRLRSYVGVGWWTSTYCTQVYCKGYHKCVAYQ